MTRRSVLLMALAVLARGDQRTDVLDVVSPLASALSNGDADEFLRRIHDEAPNRSRLETNIRGLLAQAEMTCSVQLRSIEEEGAELDWYMEIRSRATQSVMERRKGLVAVRIRNRQILSIEPIEFFRPATVR